MGLVRTLIDRDQQYAERTLPQGLRELYDGDQHSRSSPAQRPIVFGNFVSTLDGVVSYKIKGHAGGSTISGSDLGDRFIMGLLRASADAVMVGARTVHDVCLTSSLSRRPLGKLRTNFRKEVTSMPEPRYRALRILLGFLSLLMAIGGIVLIFSSKGLALRVFLHPLESEVSTLLLAAVKEMGGLLLNAEYDAFSCRSRSSAQRRHR